MHKSPLHVREKRIDGKPAGIVSAILVVKWCRFRPIYSYFFQFELAVVPLYVR